MIFEDVKSEVEREPFVPIRIHLASGKTFDLRTSGAGWMLERALLVVQEMRDRKRVGMYDVVAVEQIEKIEQMPF